MIGSVYEVSDFCFEFVVQDSSFIPCSKAVESLLHDMLIMDHLSHSLVKYIIEPLCKIKSHAPSLVPVLAEIISEIREPITTVETGPSDDQRRQNDIKVRGVHFHPQECLVPVLSHRKQCLVFSIGYTIFRHEYFVR